MNGLLNAGGPNEPGNNPWGIPGNEDRPRSPDRGPWSGRRPGIAGNPPSLDDLIARVQSGLRGVLPPGFGGGGGRRFGRGGRGYGFVLLLGLIVIGLWLASGFYRVQPDEQGVVLRFGAFVNTTQPGLNYHLPWPIESVQLPSVTHVNRLEIGYRSATQDTRIENGRDLAGRNVLEESLMLTGDENIIDIDFAVFWRIRDASLYLFATRRPEISVRSVAESVMREVIGRTPIQPALTGARAEIEQSVAKGVQAVLDRYNAGVEITQVQLQKVDPPATVIESFRDVQRANTDADRARNEAESFHNDIVPRARGDAARLTAEADGARQASVAEATGQAQRFLSVLNAYNAAKDVTLQRLYIETMQDILAHTPAVIVDDKLQGIVPFLPLNDIRTASGAPPLAPVGAGKK